MKKMKRFLSLLLAVIMVLTSADFSALAAENSANPSSKPADGTTVSQPYISNVTAGSEKFRIPAMVTLDSGRIVTAADARYNTHLDGGGLDTIVSWSEDNGANWKYTVANYLGDNGNIYNRASTAFIDPILTTDGTNVYMMVDLWPAGYALTTNNANYAPDADAENGFDDNENLRLSGDDRTSYGYYLKKNEDTSLDSYYVIMQTDADGAEDTVVEGCTVDEYFNIQGYVEETGEAVSEARDTAYSADDRFQFPAPGQTETLEAEYMVLQNSGENEDWPLEIVENSDWAGNGKFVNSLNSGDTATLYYNAPRAGTYTATVTYRSGSSANGFSLTETSGKITENENVTMGNDDSGVTCTGTFNLEVTTAGEGALVITGGESGGPQIDKIEIKAAFGTFQYTADDRFQFPDSGETKLLEAEYMELHNDTTGDGEWPLQIGDAEEWASNGKIVDAMKSGDYIDLYYNAPKAGRYTATFTYRSGDSNNGFSWEEVSGDVAKITAGNVTMGADDSAGASHEADVTFEVLEAGEGILRITSGSAGGPQLDKIEFSLTSVPVDTNLFCADSPFEVYPTNYLYLTKSETGGETWGAPTLVNAKKAGEQSYLVGPGRGLVTSDGTIIIPCYVYDSGHEITSFIYSSDDGATWTRTDDATSIRSSEAQVVELLDGTLRFFFRNSESQVCYVDATGNATDGYSWGQVVYTGVYSCSNTQMSAIKYSKRIDGKEAIIISYPASNSATGNSSWDRYNGRISIGLVQADGSMDWKYTYAVNDGGAYFWYSCLTELNDQGIALLYENGASGAAITYETFTMEELAPEANISDIWVSDADGKVAEDVTVTVGENVTLTVKDIPANDTVTVTAADGTVLEAVVAGDTLTLTGASLGDAAFASSTVTVSTVSGGEVTFNVTVTDQESENYEYVTILQSDSVTLTDDTGNYADADLSELDVNVATGTVSGKTETYDAQRAGSSSDSAYNGDYISLEDCLYTFTEVDDSDESTYVFTMSGADGSVYFNPAATTSNSRWPHTASSVNVTVTKGNAGDAFYLSAPSGSDTRYVFFNDSNKYFDAGNNIATDSESNTGYHFLLFRAKAEASDTDVISGYEQVTELADITSGEKYLIVVQIDGETSYYAAYPTTDSSTYGAYTQVAKVLNPAHEENSSEITFTGEAEGTTAVSVGDTRYYITVIAVEDKAVTLKAGETLRIFGEGGTVDEAGLDDADHKVAVVTAETKTINDFQTGLADDGDYADSTGLLSDCIYLFEKNADGTYHISATTADGTRVYLNPHTAGGNVGYPHTTTAENIVVEAVDGGGFKLIDSTDTKDDGTNYCLTFKQEWKVFNEDQTDGVTTAFELYELQEESDGTYSYQAVSAIRDGGQYVIMAEFTDANSNAVKYALHPSAVQSGDAGRNSHVAKVSDVPVETTGHEILIRGISQGTTSAVVGTTRYNITVEPADDRYITLAAGESIAVSGGIGTAPADASVATATETSATTYTKIESVDELEDCGEYLIVPVQKTTHAVSKNESNKNPSGMALTAMGDDLSALYWRILVNEDGTYSIQDPVTGDYMVLNGNDVSLLDSAQKLEIVPLTNSNYTGFGIRNGATYLNCYGGVSDDNAAAYNGADTGSTWYIYKRETTITGVAQGETTAVINGITYHITVTGLAEKYVTMYVGDKNIYTGTLVENTDTAVVGTEESTTYPYSKASDIVSGSQYLIVNGDENAIVKTTTGSGWNGNAYNGLQMQQNASFNDTDYSEYLWTITATGEVDANGNPYYYITTTNANGTVLYINLTENGQLSLIEAADTLPSYTFTANGDGYSIKLKDQTLYLNNLGGDSDNRLTSAWNDQGCHWHLYASPAETVTIVTAETVGTSDVTIGNVIYHITVKEAAATYIDTVYLTVGETEERTNQGQYDASITVDESYDEAVVTAALTDSGTSHSVTFTGVAEGRTVVDVGPTRYYVYVTKAVTDSVVSEEDIVVYVGQTKNLVSTENGVSPYEWAEGYDTYLENCSVYGVNQDLLAVRGNNNNTIEYGGISKYYVGDMVDLSDCLYTFTATDDGKYYVTGVTSDGTTVYLNHHDAGAGKANTTVDGSIYVTDAGDNLFYLNDINGTTNRYLYFHKDGTNKLNLNTGTSSECKFALYRPATADELTAGADTVLPGYVQATEVTDGQQYLIVTSYEVDGVTYYYALYPSTGTGDHDQTVQIIADQVTGNKYSSVTFTGKAPGETTLTVDTKTYNITVLEVPDELTYASSPIISKTGASSGRPLTKLSISADNSFTVGLGNGYSGENISWRIVNKDGSELTDDNRWATIENGVVTATDQADHENTHEGYIVATVDNKEYKIPLVISPAPDLLETEASRLYEVYIEDIYHTDVYYGWIYGWIETTTDEDGNTTDTEKYGSTELRKAVGGEVIYVSVGNKCHSALDFFGKPEAGYALTHMGATGSLGHYKRLEVPEGGTVADVEFIVEAGVAGNKQYNEVDSVATAALVQRAVDAGCDGAQGFTRYATATDGLSTVLSYRSEKLPTVEKKVRGVLGASQQEETYRAYTEGMAVTEGEYIYFDVIVTTYDTETLITYENVVLTDTLVGATFYEKDGTTNPTNQDGLSYKDITAEINADGLVGAVHEYYAVYEVTKTDIEDSVNGTKDSITNHVDLEFKYSTTYSNGDYEADAAAEAEILLADDKLDDIVVDFGLAVQQIHYTAGTDSYYMPTGDTPLETMYGEVTITNEAVTDTDGNVTGYNNIITYTPTKVIEGIDTVTMVDAQGVVWVFYVYPGTSVYYEEGFADYTGDWGTDISKGTGYQTLREIDTETTTNSELKDPYGYDAKYAVEAAGPSNESEAVSSTAGNRAEFTFTGGGVDIYANGQGDADPTGTLSVLVRNADTGTMEKLLIVSTKVAGTDGDVTEGQNSLTSAYNLPVASIRSLSQGTHQVTIGHSRTQEEANNNTTYPVRLDGFRVYLTMKDQSIYLQHEEANPVFLEMRNAVLGAIDLGDVLITTDEDGNEVYPDSENASIYAEDIAAGLTQVYNSSEAADPAYTSAKAYVVKSDEDVYTASAKDLLDNGPKNELFLYPGESLIFGLVGGLSNVQIGMKAVNGAVDAMSVTKQINTTAADGTTTTTAPEDMGIASLATSTDMFYRIGGTDASTDTETKTATITITNNSTNGSVLSITDLKYFNATMSTVEPLTDLSANDFMPMVLALGYTENPDANEPTEAKVTDVFSDVVEGAWYVDSVQYVYDAGIMTGSGNLFTPENDMTRAQVVATLYRLAGSPEVTDYSACDELVDVEENAWYTDAVCWAYNTGIGTGNLSTKMFNVNSSVTRQQLAAFFYRYAIYKGLDTTASADISEMLNADQVSAYAEEAVKWAVGAGILSGSETTDAAGNTVYDLKPVATATRAQMASILMGFCEAYNL